MTESINLTFSYEEKEIVSAARIFYAEAYHTRFIMIVSALGAAAGLALILLTEVFFLGYTFLLICGLYFYISYLTYFNSPRNFFHRNSEAYRRKITMQFFEDKIVSFSEVGKSENSWEFYDKVWETRDAYFLFYGGDLFTLIPKRAFNNSTDELEFRDLISRRISPIKRIGSRWKNKKEESREYLPPANPPDWR